MGVSGQVGATRHGDADYPLFRGYAVISDGRTAALAYRFGSVDWLCLAYFSGAAVFGAILDHCRGRAVVYAHVPPQQVSPHATNGK